MDRTGLRVLDSRSPRETYAFSGMRLGLCDDMNSIRSGNHREPETLTTLEKRSVRYTEYTANSPAMEYPAMMISGSVRTLAEIASSRIHSM